MAIYQRGPKKIWHAVIFIKGRQRWKSLKTTDWQTAKREEAKLLIGHNSLDPISKMPWEALKKRYLDYSRREKKPKTYEADQQVLERFERILHEAGHPIKYLSDFTKTTAEIFKEKRQSEGVKDSTINRGIEILKAMGQWMEDEEILEINPLRKVKKKKLQKRIPKPYSNEEIEKIREEGCWDSIDRLLVNLGYYTGRRRAEIARMKRSQIDFERKVIYPSEDANTIKNEGLVPLHPVLERMLLDWFKESPEGENVIELNGRPLRPEYITLNFRRISKRAGVKGSFHRFRHTFISRLTDHNMNMNKIRDMVGHQNISTTQGYSRVEVESIRKDLEDAL